MKKLFLMLITVFTLSSLFTLPVTAEDATGISYLEEKFDNVPHYINPRYPEEMSLFELKYTNAQKAAILRGFLVERLSNVENYANELTFIEHRFSTDAYASDILLVNLAEFSNFEMYVNSANQAATKEIISIVFNEIRTKYPELFWVDNYCFWTYRQYKVTGIGFKLNCYTDFNVNNGTQPVINKIKSLTAEFDNYVQSIVDLIPNSYSDYQKILFVNDYLCVNYKYDGNYDIYNAYAFFEEGTGVCQAYTLAFMAIMDELDIKCDSVVSKEMNHMWNLVQLNEKWYHIDVTWNDPYFSTSNTDTFGLAKHNYFLLSSDCIKDSEHNHYGFNVDSYGYEIGTDYDEVEIDLNRSLKSSFVELNGIWYNTGYYNGARTCGLYAFNSPDISSISNKDFATPIYQIERYVGSYLSKYKDTLLFNTPSSIYAFNGNEFFEIYTHRTTNANEKIYGFDIKNDTIRIQLATNPNNLASNAIVKTFNIVDIIYTDYDSTVLFEGFAVEGEKIPDMFTSNTNGNWYTDEMCTDGNEYDFDAPVTGDLVLYKKRAEYKLTIKCYNETTKQATIYASEATEGILIFTSYDENNCLIDCKFTICSGDAKLTTGINECKAPDGFNTEGAGKAKVMLLESLTSLTPICESLEK